MRPLGVSVEPDPEEVVEKLCEVSLVRVLDDVNDVLSSLTRSSSE